MKVLADIDDRVYKEVKNPNIESGYNSNDCYDAIWKGTPIYDNSTNGDMIRTLFPNAKWWVNEDNEVFTDMPWKPEKCVYFDLDWWNAPYKAESKER